MGIITLLHVILSTDKESEKTCTGFMWFRIMANDGLF